MAQDVATEWGKSSAFFTWPTKRLSWPRVCPKTSLRAPVITPMTLFVSNLDTHLDIYMMDQSTPRPSLNASLDHLSAYLLAFIISSLRCNSVRVMVEMEDIAFAATMAGCTYMDEPTDTMLVATADPTGALPLSHGALATPAHLGLAVPKSGLH